MKDEKEWSNQFDVLYNNITSNQAPGLNEYEKSVFLTKAQEEKVKNYFNPKGNTLQDGFDSNPKRQHDFSTLMRTTTLGYSASGVFDSRGLDYILDDEIFLILSEYLTTTSGDIYTIAPISYQEYDRLMQKPYKYPPKNQAWRLMVNNGTYTKVDADSDTLFEDTVTFTTYNTVKTLSATVNWYSDTDASVSITIEETDDNINIDGTVHGAYSLGDFVDYVNNALIENNISSVILSVSNSNRSVTFDSFGYDSGEGDVCSNLKATSTEVTTGILSEVIGRHISTSNIPTYKVRYVKRPAPIILEDLEDTGLSINGETAIQDPICELPDTMHDEILQRAVELAKAAWTATGNENLNAAIEMGKRSE